VLPGEAEVRSAWFVRYAIHANAPVEADYILSRNGLVIARGRAALRPGPNHFFARDAAEEDGILQYRLEVMLSGDAVPQNNCSEALLRVRGGEKALVVSSVETPGLLANSLAAAAIPFDSFPPERFPDSPALLESYRLVILENCRLIDFPGGGAQALAAAVDAGLASLLITGGSDSFGTGGYHRSPLDPLLPVELELRNERRRGTTAVAIALDRSGSMAADAGNGRTKMDIANLGAAESIRLLSPRDQAAVIAVDSQPHVIVPLSQADAADDLARLIRGIQSMGGGIYCRTALEAAAGEIRKSSLSNRHIILFADAADAEEQDGCLELAERIGREGVGLSVIAMGTVGDSDAGFLRELAAAGGGEALFSSHAGGLPALFTQEIMRVSRRGFLEEAVTPRLAPSFAMLGVQADSPPRLGGVNVSSAREGALVFMDIDDGFGTPLLAARANGRSWTGAVLFELDGRHSGSFPAWPQAPELIVSLSRLLASGVNHVPVKAYSRLDRGVAEARFEFSPEAIRQFRNVRPVLKWLAREGLVAESEMEWLEPGIAAARFPLARPGTYLPLADLGELGVAAAPSLSLSYSPEYAPESGRDGLALLRSLADAAGGGDGLDISDLRRSARAERPGGVELRPFLFAAFLLMFLLELAARRLWIR
ncbi:MAG: VWA domain-containing protein, partial [Planctomycetota bacterium]|nr:VWA domain-containing protein [Planctomycetota bacterium]